MGLFTPFTVKSKITLRKLWASSPKDWDDPVPEQLKENCTRAHTQKRARTPARTRTRVRTDTRAHTRACLRTGTCTRTHALALSHAPHARMGANMDVPR